MGCCIRTSPLKCCCSLHRCHACKPLQGEQQKEKHNNKTVGKLPSVGGSRMSDSHSHAARRRSSSRSSSSSSSSRHMPISGCGYGSGRGERWDLWGDGVAGGSTDGLNKRRGAPRTARPVLSYSRWAKVGQSSHPIWRRPSLLKWMLVDTSRAFCVATIHSSTSCLIKCCSFFCIFLACADAVIRRTKSWALNAQLWD